MPWPQPRSIFLLLFEPNVDAPHHLAHEHFPIVALGPNQKVTKILNVILAVADRHVVACPRHVDIQSAADYQPRRERKRYA